MAKITAKELAKQLGLSEAAVSLALNNKAGVSTETRKKVLLEAERLGYDLDRIREKRRKGGTLAFIIYKKSGAIVDDTPFFSELSEGIRQAAAENGYKLYTSYFFGSDDEASSADEIYRLLPPDCDGLLLLGTEMVTDDLRPFLSLALPLVLLDSYFETFACDTVLINNEQGAYQAARHLIRTRHAQPGYLSSSVRINNFLSRADGFYKAVRAYGYSASRTIVHELTPSLAGAYADMKEILSRGEPLARSYFADNDLIAAGAFRAMKEAGLRIPEDVALIGFDNMPVSQVTDPALSTVHVPKQYMGRQAVKRLIERIAQPEMPIVKQEIATTLVDRYSC